MTDEELREAYGRAIASRAPGTREGCPAPEAILALVRRKGSEDERLPVLDHVMGCAACRSEFELLRAIERAGEKAGSAEAESAARGSARAAYGRVVGHIAWQRWTPLAAAAAVLLVVTVGPGRQLWQSGAETMRGDGEPLALIAPADASTRSGEDVAFVWHSWPGVERYTLEVMTSGGEVALSRTTADTAVALKLLPTLPAGDYRWAVTATSEDGAELRSGTRALRLSRR